MSLQDFSTTSESLRDARVAVTGASGFIGLQLCERLCEVRAHLLTLRRPGSAASAPDGRAVTVDLSDAVAVSQLLAREKPDIVVHLAGFVSGDRSAKAMKEAFEGNVITTANVLFACADVVPACRVVCATSLDASNPWREAAETGSPYGASKLQVELLTGALHQLQDANMLCARIGMVYGPKDFHEQRLVPTLVSSLLAGVSPRVSSGLRRCDFVHVSDVVEGLLALATSPRPNVPSLDLGTGTLTSIRDVAETVRELCESAVPVIYDSSLDRPQDQERAADIAVTRTSTGWRARFDLQAGLADTVYWHQTQRGTQAPRVPVLLSALNRSRTPLHD